MKQTILLRTILLISSAMLPISAAQAQTHNDEEHGDQHAGSSDEIVVVGHPPVDFNMLQSTQTFGGDDLLLSGRAQIGDVLARLPGVSSSSFAPGAARPVLRGFDGDRIRVLTDGIGTIDASNVSADHAVVFDSLTVDHIDVLHGPAVLLFGGQAIGGAVNALDKRIPRGIPAAPDATVITGYGSAADERSVAGAVNVALAPRWALHLDASWRESDDVRIPGFVASPSLRADLLADAAEHRADGELEEADELTAVANLAGRIPNSGSRSTTFGAGLAFIDDGGDLGISFQRQDLRYGVPLRPGTGHGHEEGEEGHEGENVTIDLAQTRVDLRGTLKFGGLFDSLQIRGAFGDYLHVELEGDEVGTTFAGNGLEFRADLVQNERGGWRGRSGVQYYTRKLTIVGDEAFTPNNNVSRFGAFTLQAFKFGPFEVEAAGRFEHARVNTPSAGFDRTFNLWSGAAGLSYSPAENVKLGVSYTRGARAPAPEELLSDGPHIATQSYELGDPDFDPERSNSWEAYLSYTGERAQFKLTGYHTSFDRFIAALPTGAEEDDLPVFAYAQGPATFKGFEASASVRPLVWTGGSLSFDAAADYTHAELDGIGPVPRIPPLRLRGGMDLEHAGLHFRAEVEWNDAQDRVAAFENPVAGFTMVNLSLDWHPFGEEGPLTLLLSANNLFDVEARRASSFTRDFVPLAGRDLRVTAKLSF